MKRVFAGTFYWIAVVNARDRAHRKAIEVGRGFGSISIMMTDEVLTELMTFCASDFKVRMKAAATVDSNLSAPHVRVIPQTRASFLSGLELYRDRPDKRYSLTDCISMQTMRHQGLLDVLTNDQHSSRKAFAPFFAKLNAPTAYSE